MSNRFVVIMAGGTGTRLWPLSREARPKQFLKLLADTSLLEETYSHVRRSVPADQVYVMADAPRAALAKEQLPELPDQNLIIEPSRRDNGPAIGLVSQIIEQDHPGALVAIIWSDHRVTKGEQLARCLNAAFDALEQRPDDLVTIAVKPTYPATQFGYLKMGRELELGLAEPVFSVDSFKEKPDSATAETYVADWRYLWNTGVKVFRAQLMGDLFRQHQPADAHLLAQISDRRRQHPHEPINDLWEQLTARDIEHLITEQVKDMLVIPADLGWSDIGSWSIVHDVLKEHTGDEMVVRAEHIDVDSENCLIISDQRLVATAGLQDIVIVDTPDALLVINRDSSQSVKQLVDALKERNQSLL